MNVFAGGRKSGSCRSRSLRRTEAIRVLVRHVLSAYARLVRALAGGLRARCLAVVLLLGVLPLGLAVAGEVFAQAGGGSSGFGGGGGGGSSGGGSGGGGGGLGGGGGGGAGGDSGGGFAVSTPVAIVLLVVLVVVLALGLSDGARKRGRGEARAVVRFFARPFSARRRKRRAQRVRQVELAAAEAVEDDERFAPEALRTAAEALFRDVQRAWDARDNARLATLLGPDLLVEWERRLADFKRKRWRSRVQVPGEVRVEYVGLTNREGDRDDRVVVRIEATVRAYVADRSGRRMYRKGQSGETIELCQYWTLGIREDRWILVSIEEDSEGEHQLEEPIVAMPWSDAERMRDEALVEAAVADAPPPGFKPADLADLDFDGDARAAALDLSLADPRFAPDVLEVTARAAVDAWAQAVDGDDRSLERLASSEAVAELLHPGDATRRTRLVVRGPRVRRIHIAALDADRDPATMTVELELHGGRYIEDRDSAALATGSRDAAQTFTERWTLALNGPDASPWQIVAADAPPQSA